MPTRTTDEGRDAQIRDLEARLEEQERARGLLWALDAASVAMGAASTAEGVYEAVGSTLHELGFRTSVLLLDESGGLAIHYLSAPSRVLHEIEKRTGLSRARFRVPADATMFHRRVLEERETVFERDATPLTEAVLPGFARPLAKAIVRLLGVGQLIGAPLIVEERSRGMLVVSSNRLAHGDIPAVRVFAQQVSAALEKTELVERLRNNVRELESAQAQLVASQRLEALGRLAGGIAHDINNLLTTIDMTLELVRTGTDSLEDDLGVISDASARAAALIQQLLAFGRQQVLERRPLDINALLSGMDRLLERSVGDNVELSLQRSDGPAVVNADGSQLEQVLLNLAINAGHAMPEGGCLTFTPQRIEIPERGPHVCLTVADTGSGMDARTVARAFEPFFTTKARGEGTGLGLAVSYGIVTQHDGWIDIDSAPGEGTRFYIYLPASESDVRVDEEARTAVEHGAGDGRTILLVEDEDAVRRIAGRVLERAGYIVWSAGTYDEGLALFEEHGDRIGLMFSDVVLPDRSGPQLAAELWRRRPSLPVLFTTGYADMHGDWDQMTDRQWALLQKPYSPSQLLEAIERLGARPVASS